MEGTSAVERRVGCEEVETHSMRSVIGASKMDHAIKTSKRGASTLAMMLIEFLLGQDVSTILVRWKSVAVGLQKDPRNRITSQEKDTICEQGQCWSYEINVDRLKGAVRGMDDAVSMAKWMEMLPWSCSCFAGCHAAL